MVDKFKGFWMMVAGERDEQYLHPVTSEDIATQLHRLGWLCVAPADRKMTLLDDLDDREPVSLVLPRGPWRTSKTPYLDPYMEMGGHVRIFKAASSNSMTTHRARQHFGLEAEDKPSVRMDHYEEAETTSASVKAMEKLSKPDKAGG